MDKEKNNVKKNNCDCNKPTFQNEPKKDCVECMYKDLLYLVP